MIGNKSVDFVRAGAALGNARAAMVLLHGRGAAAETMLSLAEELAQTDVAYLIPRAPGRSWYPYSFLAPLAQNEPALSNALDIVGRVIAVIEEGMPAERIAILGFSQGGCLALEYAARNARLYGAVIGLSAGLIGPQGNPRNYSGSLAGTPVFVGCSDIDDHIPLWRVRETSEVMRALGGAVTERIYPGMGHTVTDDEIEYVRRFVEAIEESA
jgi:phospholipase/carboxylesterase